MGFQTQLQVHSPSPTVKEAAVWLPHTPEKVNKIFFIPMKPETPRKPLASLVNGFFLFLFNYIFFLYAHKYVFCLEFRFSLYSATSSDFMVKTTCLPGIDEEEEAMLLVRGKSSLPT